MEGGSVVLVPAHPPIEGNPHNIHIAIAIHVPHGNTPCAALPCIECIARPVCPFGRAIVLIDEETVLGEEVPIFGGNHVLIVVAIHIRCNYLRMVLKEKIINVHTIPTSIDWGSI